ncbi:MAG: Crp/Fnr family transcriptional regulator, partial [Gemmatimonadota bacterium]|nr:Crp/Fnr family transcriptional regulator [Gemmatimonadota bacterium]
PLILSQHERPNPTGVTSTVIRNKLLKLLPPGELESLLAASKLVTVRTREIIFSRGATVPYVHFPEDCVISLVTQMADGDAVEAMTIGNDGFSAISVLNGVDSMNCLGCGQVSGKAWRIDRHDFRLLLGSSPALTRVLQRYGQLVFETVSQSAACNRLHVVEQRCARWLLMSHDRVGRPTFDLTQEFLAEMLGVRRAGVTVAVGVLKRQGLISSGRGSITIADRTGLERASCECYQVIKNREAAILA